MFASNCSVWVSADATPAIRRGRSTSQKSESSRNPKSVTPQRRPRSSNVATNARHLDADPAADLFQLKCRILRF